MHSPTDPIGFLIRAPNPDDQPDSTLFIRDRDPAEAALDFRRGPQFPPGAMMRPLYWANGDFTLTEPEMTDEQ